MPDSALPEMNEDTPHQSRTATGFKLPVDGIGIAEPDSASMSDVHEARLRDIARALREGEIVPPITVRAFLSWFWRSQRRGRWIVFHIRSVLKANSLVTVPDFESAYIDAEISFALATAEDSGPGVTQVASVQSAQDPADKPELKTAPPSSTDPTYRISKLAAANRKPIWVSPDATLAEAITLMMANDFSQLPVMTNERDVKGAVGWKSVGTRLALGKTVNHVRDAMVPHTEIQSEASLFAAIPLIVEHDYVLVRAGDRTVMGIITTSDLSLQFEQLSEPFLLLGEIENHIRRILNKCFSLNELSKAKDASDVNRPIESAADLTFGEYKKLLESPDRWANLGLSLDRSIFVRLLDQIRETRNDVMHFDPDGVEDAALTGLRDFVKLLRDLQALGAT